jgi:hypothetical protein
VAPITCPDLSIAAKKRKFCCLVVFRSSIKEIESFLKIQKILVDMEKAVVKNSTRMIFLQVVYENC